MRKDNRGLTLIELVVTVAIAMVFSGVILTFVAGASKSYRRTSAGAQSQIEMQDALDQIENLTISTNLSMYYTKGINKNTNITADQKIANDSDMDRPLAQSKTLFSEVSQKTVRKVITLLSGMQKKRLCIISHRFLSRIPVQEQIPEVERAQGREKPVARELVVLVEEAA